MKQKEPSAPGPGSGSIAGGSPTLLLFPTELERRRFRDLGGVEPGFALPLIVGFGVVAAAARTSQYIATYKPRRILLMGIAGTFLPDEHPVAEARVFTRVAIDGIGAGSGRDFMPPSELGFPQWPGNTEPGSRRGSDPSARTIGEELGLAHPSGTPEALLLTTCAASNSNAEVEERLERHPDALAEDMEGFGVALACALGGVPLAIVRGLSNRVGDRDATNWSIPAALAAARRIAEVVLQDAHWEEAR